jgi:hypothetical protein
VPRWIELQEAIARKVFAGVYRKVSGSGHLIAVDRPDVVAREILRLVESASSLQRGTKPDR